MTAFIGAKTQAAIRRKSLYAECAVSRDTETVRAQAAATRFGLAAGLITHSEVAARQASGASAPALALCSRTVMHRLRELVRRAVLEAGCDVSRGSMPGTVQASCSQGWSSPGLAVYQDGYEILDFSRLWELPLDQRQLVLAVTYSLVEHSDYCFATGVGDHPYTDSFSQEFLYDLDLDRLASDADALKEAVHAVAADHGDWGEAALHATVFEHQHREDLAWMRAELAPRLEVLRIRGLLRRRSIPSPLKAWARKVLRARRVLERFVLARPPVDIWINHEEEGMVPRGNLNLVCMGSPDLARVFGLTLDETVQQEQGLDLLTLEPRAARWVVSTLVRANITHALLREGMNAVFDLAAKHKDKQAA